MVMVGAVVHRVHADRVQTELLENGNITRAGGIIGERIGGPRTASRLVVDLISKHN